MNRNLIKVTIAAALLVASVMTTLALSVDQARNFSRRFFGYQMAHYYRLTLNYNDPGQNVAQKFGSLSKDAFILDIACYVTTVFNGTTPTWTLGVTSTSANEIMTTGGGSTRSVDLTSAAFYHLTAASGLGTPFTASSGDLTLYSKYSQAGTPSTGLASCVMQYAPHNDM